MKKILITMFIVANLFCFASVVFASNTDEIKSLSLFPENIINNNETLINSYAYYVVITHANGDKEIFFANSTFGRTNVGNAYGAYPTTTGEKVTLFIYTGGNSPYIENNCNYGNPLSNTITTIKSNHDIYNYPDYTYNLNNAQPTTLFHEADFFQEPETPVEPQAETSGETPVENNQAETISGELPEIVGQLQEMSAEKMQIAGTMRIITIVAISCLALLLLSVILPKVLRIFLPR